MPSVTKGFSDGVSLLFEVWTIGFVGSHPRKPNQIERSAIPHIKARSGQYVLLVKQMEGMLFFSYRHLTARFRISDDVLLIGVVFFVLVVACVGVRRWRRCLCHHLARWFWWRRLWWWTVDVVVYLRSSFASCLLSRSNFDFWTVRSSSTL